MVLFERANDLKKAIKIMAKQYFPTVLLLRCKKLQRELFCVRNCTRVMYFPCLISRITDGYHVHMFTCHEWGQCTSHAETETLSSKCCIVGNGGNMAEIKGYDTVQHL